MPRGITTILRIKQRASLPPPHHRAHGMRARLGNVTLAPARTRIVPSARSVTGVTANRQSIIGMARIASKSSRALYRRNALVAINAASSKRAQRQ